MIIEHKFLQIKRTLLSRVLFQEVLLVNFKKFPIILFIVLFTGWS
jgi:hypothetical protein